MPGWLQSTAKARSFADLPPNAQAYIRRVESLVGVPIRMVSVGPNRSEVIPVMSAEE